MFIWCMHTMLIYQLLLYFDDITMYIIPRKHFFIIFQKCVLFRISMKYCRTIPSLPVGNTEDMTLRTTFVELKLNIIVLEYLVFDLYIMYTVSHVELYVWIHKGVSNEAAEYGVSSHQNRSFLFLTTLFRDFYSVVEPMSVKYASIVGVRLK